MTVQLESHAKHLGSVRIVLDDQDRPLRDGGQPGRRGRHELLLLIERETNHEFAAPPRAGAPRLHAAAVFHDELPDHRESEPETRSRLLGQRAPP